MDHRASDEAPYPAARSLFDWVAERRSEVTGRLILAGHSEESIRGLSAATVIDVGYVLLLDHARVLDQQDALRRSIAGGEPSLHEVNLVRALNGLTPYVSQSSPGTEEEAEIVDFAEFANRMLAKEV